MEKRHLLREIRGLLSPPEDDRFVEHEGLFYNWRDIDVSTWTPKPGVIGVVKNRRWSQIYNVGGVRVHF